MKVIMSSQCEKASILIANNEACEKYYDHHLEALKALRSNKEFLHFLHKKGLETKDLIPNKYAMYSEQVLKKLAESPKVFHFLSILPKIC